MSAVDLGILFGTLGLAWLLNKPAVWVAALVIIIIGLWFLPLALVGGLD